MNDPYTTGEAAAICGVSPPVITRHFDQGTLRGYRIPGSRERRIPREELYRFMVENGIPTDHLPDLKQERILHVGVSSTIVNRIRAEFGNEYKQLHVDNSFAAGFHCSPQFPACMIVDTSIGMQSLQAISDFFKRRGTKYKYCILINATKSQLEDLDDPSFTDVFHKPFDPDLLVKRVSRIMQVYRP